VMFVSLSSSLRPSLPPSLALPPSLSFPYLDVHVSLHVHCVVVVANSPQNPWPEQVTAAQVGEAFTWLFTTEKGYRVSVGSVGISGY